MNNDWKQIKAIIFDLDGVLVDSRNLHYESLNIALKSFNYEITLEEHIGKYDGLPTKDKLNLLSKEKNLPIELHTEIWKKKQDITNECIKKYINKDDDIIELLNKLRNDGYKLYCCSNSIKNTLEQMLSSLEIIDYFDGIYCSEDVKYCKPHPQIYMKCIFENNLIAQQVLIIEDSPIGKTAAILSGAHLCPVADTTEVTYEYIIESIKNANKTNINKVIDTRWKNKIQVVIPMAGKGSRFSLVGYDRPKPLILINKKPMIEWVIDNLNLSGAKYIFIVSKTHLENWNLEEILLKISPGCNIIATDEITEGPAASVLLAREILDPNIPLLIANSDQYLEWDINSFLYQSKNVDGAISVFNQPDRNDTKWSYVKVNNNGYAIEVREKEAISNNASTGIYYWNKAGDFIKYADRMIAENIRVNNEFYVCPVYNEAIKDGQKIKIFNCKKMWGLGVPSDLDIFIRDYLQIL